MEDTNTTYNRAATQFVMALSMPIEYLDMITDRVLMKVKPLLAADKEPDEIMTTSEAAQYLKASEGQIYQWVNRSSYNMGDNPMPYMKAGKCLRFSKNDLIQWMKTKKDR